MGAQKKKFVKWDVWWVWGQFMLDKYSSPNSIVSDSHCGHQLNVFISVSQEKVLQIELACQIHIEFLRVILQLRKAEKKIPTSGEKKNGPQCRHKKFKKNSSCSFRYWSYLTNVGFLASCSNLGDPNEWHYKLHRMKSPNSVWQLQGINCQTLP